MDEETEFEPKLNNYFDPREIFLAGAMWGLSARERSRSITRADIRDASDRYYAHTNIVNIEQIGLPGSGSWQPFDTIPVDGTNVIVLMSTGNVFIAHVDETSDFDRGKVIVDETSGHRLSWDRVRYWCPLPDTSKLFLEDRIP